MWGGASAEYGYGIAIDGTNNVFVTGYFQGTNIDFNPSVSSNTLSSNGVGSDIFIAKYNSSGAYQWAFNLGGTSADLGYGIAIDATNNIFVTGYFSGTSIDFDPSATSNTLSAIGGQDIFVASYADYNKWLGTNNSWSNTGNWSYAATPTSTDNIVIPATANQPSIGTGTAAVGNTLTIQSGSTLSLSGSGSLNISNGIIVNSGGALVGTSANITGTVTLQQNIIAQRGWRIFANPFATAQTIATVATNNGITIGTIANGASGLTDSRTHSNSTNNWSNVTGTSWSANTPYALFIRGLGYEVTGNTYTGGPTSFTYSVSGTLNGASVNTTPSSSSNFMVMGNPYAAPVNTQALTGGVSRAYYTYQITQGGNQTAQQTKAGSWIVAGSNSNTTKTIPVLGALAFIPASTSPFAITASTDINTTGTPETSLFNTSDNNGLQQIELNITQKEQLQDRLYLRIDKDATPNSTDAADVLKFYNDNVNFYTKTVDQKHTAIDARNVFDKPVPLGINGLMGDYTLRLGYNNIQNTKVVLKDKFLNTETELQNNTTYNFSITADANSKGENRFELIIQAKAAVDVDNINSAGFSAKVLNTVISNGQLRVQVNSNKPATIQIVDLNGKRIATKAAVNGLNVINIYHKAKGMYIVQVTDGTNQVTEKVVKQ